LSYKALFHKQTNKEIRDEIDVAYTDKATPLARFSSLQGTAISFVLLSIAMAFAWFIFVFPFLNGSFFNWAWFVGMITLPFTLTGLYLYIRIIPVEYAFRRWEKTRQEVVTRGNLWSDASDVAGSVWTTANVGYLANNSMKPAKEHEGCFEIL